MEPFGGKDGPEPLQSARLWKKSNYYSRFGEALGPKAKPPEGLSAVRGLYQSEDVWISDDLSSRLKCSRINMNDQQLLDEDQVDRIIRSASPERLYTYMYAVGHDRQRATRLYIWNAKLGEAFHIAIQAVEVSLRNSIGRTLLAEYGDRWWTDLRYLALLDHDRHQDLELVQRRIANRRLDQVHGQIVAGLSFGFWVGMLQGRYNPSIWSGHLRSTFPHLPPEKGRKSLAKAVSQIATLRNRISHHEPLLKRDPLQDYALVMETLRWICRDTADWIAPHCRVPEIVRQRP